MPNKHAAPFKELDDAGLLRSLAETKEELFNLRFQHATGALDNTAALARVKRDIARLLTLANESATAGRGA